MFPWQSIQILDYINQPIHLFTGFKVYNNNAILGKHLDPNLICLKLKLKNDKNNVHKVNR